jgi:hypothetical protein
MTGIVENVKRHRSVLKLALAFSFLTSFLLFALNPYKEILERWHLVKDPPLRAPQIANRSGL